MVNTSVSGKEDVRPPPKGMMLLVMRAIAVLGGNADSFAIRDYIARIMNSDIPTAQVAIMLLRLERRGYVSSQISERDGKSRRGRPRKIYWLTFGGKRSLETAVRLLTASDNIEEAVNEESAAAEAC